MQCNGFLFSFWCVHEINRPFWRTKYIVQTSMILWLKIASKRTLMFYKKLKKAFVNFYDWKLYAVRRFFFMGLYFFLYVVALKLYLFQVKLPIYLHWDFDILQFEISSLMNWIFFLVWKQTGYFYQFKQDFFFQVSGLG